MSLSFHLTIMVHIPESSKDRGAKMHPGESALALRTRPMATTLASVETREVVRCDYCSLVQYRTTNSICRKCHKPLDIEEPARPALQLVPHPSAPPSAEAGLQVAHQVREIRRARHLSQRQLAGRMQVPRTYISKIENGKAVPTLGSLERLPEDPAVFDSARMVEFVRGYVQEQATQGNCVVVGRGAAVTLAKSAGAFHVFVYSSMTRKIRWFEEHFPEHAKDAEREILATDRRRAEYIRRFHQREWDDRRLYHLMLNSCMGMKAMVGATIEAVGMRTVAPATEHAGQAAS